jgi:hypothetical protein
MSDKFDKEQAFNFVQKYGTEREELVHDPYKPPPGSPSYKTHISQLRYEPDLTSSHVARMDPYEQEHVFELAWYVASVFQVQPIPDALYASVPTGQKSKNMFCVISRTDVRPVSSEKIAWPAILVLVKEIPVVKVICTLDFSLNKFDIWQLILWVNEKGSYEKPITNGNKPMDPVTLLPILDQYRKVERIF